MPGDPPMPPDDGGVWEPLRPHPARRPRHPAPAAAFRGPSSPDLNRNPDPGAIHHSLMALRIDDWPRRGPANEQSFQPSRKPAEAFLFCRLTGCCSGRGPRRSGLAKTIKMPCDRSHETSGVRCRHLADERCGSSDDARSPILARPSPAKNRCDPWPSGVTGLPGPCAGRRGAALRWTCASAAPRRRSPPGAS